MTPKKCVIVKNEGSVRAQKQRAIFRWDEFKEARALFIEKFIAIKMKQITAGHVAREIVAKRALLKLKERFEARRDAKRAEEQLARVTFRLTCTYKLRLKKMGGSDKIRRMEHKSMFTLLSHFTHQRAETSSKELLLQVLTKTKLKHEFNQAITKFDADLKFIVKKMCSKRFMVEAKVKILQYYWDKLLADLSKKSLKLKDKQTRDLLLLLKNVPIEIRVAVLTKFVKHCMLLNSIAQKQWRVQQGLGGKQTD